jgi:hypothetical protein
MLRRLRVSSGGYAYRVLNRAVERMRIFGKQRDFEAFEDAIEQAVGPVADVRDGVVGPPQSCFMLSST